MLLTCKPRGPIYPQTKLHENLFDYFPSNLVQQIASDMTRRAHMFVSNWLTWPFFSLCYLIPHRDNLFSLSTVAVIRLNRPVFMVRRRRTDRVNWYVLMNYLCPLYTSFGGKHGIFHCSFRLCGISIPFIITQKREGRSRQ